MYRRLELLSKWLEWSGLKHRANYYMMLQRLAGPNPVEPVKTLADILEPVKEYARARLKTYTQQTPLNRMVDTVRPESDVARHFTAMDRSEQRRWLTKWRDNDARLKPVLEHSALLSEVAPLSAAVSHLAEVGLKALDYIDSRQRAPEAWVNQQRAFVGSLKGGHAELLISIVPAIERMIADAATR